MSDFTTVNILDMINAIGEEELQLILSDFSCPNNHESEGGCKKKRNRVCKAQDVYYIFGG